MYDNLNLGALALAAAIIAGIMAAGGTGLSPFQKSVGGAKFVSAPSSISGRSNFVPDFRLDHAAVAGVTQLGTWAGEGLDRVGEMSAANAAPYPAE